jgi:hypothetical protein
MVTKPDHVPPTANFGQQVPNFWASMMNTHGKEAEKCVNKGMSSL